MNKKFISLIMAALLAVSASAVSVSAAETEKETAGAEVTLETSADGKTFFFDSGDWNSKSINFYIWDSTTGEYATATGDWGTDTWGSRKKIGGKAVEGQEGVFESYEVDFSGREDHVLNVIFHDPDTGAQTFDALINNSVYGTKASRNGQIYENPKDSDKTAEGVVFEGGSGLGVARVITSTGKVQGDIIHPSVDRADAVAQYVLNYLGDEKANLTEDTVAEVINQFDTNADDVWAKYLTYEGNSDYDGKFDKEKAKAVIKPTESSDTTSSNQSSTSSSESSSSNSSSSSSSTSSSNGTTTTKSGSTTSTSATTATTTATSTDSGSADTASTGDTRGVIAFAGVLVAAAGTIIATRKKIED